MQRFIRHYKEVTGRKEVDMREVARLAERNGWPMPKPVDPLDILARQFADAAKEETRYDQRTRRPYRANLVVWQQQGTQQLPLYIDIDEDHPRHVIVKSLMKCREQTVSDLVQLTFTADHWTAAHPRQEAIVIPCDLTDDVEWRRNGEERAS